MNIESYNTELQQLVISAGRPIMLSGMNISANPTSSGSSSSLRCMFVAADAAGAVAPRNTALVCHNDMI